jgi:hypothetical protein
MRRSERFFETSSHDSMDKFKDDRAKDEHHYSEESKVIQFSVRTQSTEIAEEIRRMVCEIMG